jgi:protein TonB
MSTTTVNTFPPLHTFDSPRSWFLASIIVLHVGFFWALSNGFSISKMILRPPQTQARFVPDKTTPTPTPPEPVLDFDRRALAPYTPLDPQLPNPEYDLDDPIRGMPTPQPIPPIERSAPTQPAPTIVQPAIPSSGLSEPLYPASEIRAGHTGTVMLSVQVLANGRVGEVRVMSSSGFAKLDASAVREARNWRFVPGTRDGVPVVLWKQVPITFELTDRDR